MTLKALKIALRFSLRWATKNNAVVFSFLHRVQRTEFPTFFVKLGGESKKMDSGILIREK